MEEFSPAHPVLAANGSAPAVDDDFEIAATHLRGTKKVLDPAEDLGNTGTIGGESSAFHNGTKNCVPGLTENELDPVEKPARG